MAKIKNLKDGDYVLTENRAWFTVGGRSVRIYVSNGTIFIDAYVLGSEAEDTAWGMEVPCA